jgi:lipopolysaccharide export system permease protein
MKMVRDSIGKKGGREMDKYFHYSTQLTKEPQLHGVIATAYIPDSLDGAIDAKLMTTLNEIRSNLQYAGYEMQGKNDEIMYSKIEWHRKYALSLACLILFFIGAPLGSIIRKGGFGMPLVVAIILFLIFHLFNVFGEKFVKEHVMSPFAGMWLSVMVLTPVCMFFTYKAMNDSQLFSREFYFRMLRPLKKILVKLK